MAQPAAKAGDSIVAQDQHQIQPPGPSGPFMSLFPFYGRLDGNLSNNVMIEGKPAAVKGSTATNTPRHLPQGGSFVRPPSNRGEILAGSRSVLINGKPAARNGDQAETCADPMPNRAGRVVAAGTILVGD